MNFRLLLLLALFFPAALATGQTLSIDEPGAPAGALIAQTTGNTFSRAFHNHTTAGKASRGQTFLMPDTGDANTGYTITGITLQKNATQTFAAGDTLELWIFPWDPDNDGNDGTSWTQTGTNGFQDGDPLSGTGMTPLLVNTFDLNGLTFTNGLHFTIDLSASPLTFAENKVYAFMFAYTDGDGTGGNNDYFEVKEANSSVYADGAEPRVQGVGAANANNLTTSRDLTFWLQGSAINATAEVTNSPTAPTTNILATKALGTTGTNLFSITANANHARGQLFSLGESGGTTFEISKLTVQKQTEQSYLNDTITLRIFQGTQAQWDTGTGRLAGNPDFYSGTTVTPLHTEVFTLNGTFPAGDFVTFQLATPLTVPENTDFGFFLTYDQVGGAQSTFSHFEANNGGRISIDDDSHDTSTRSMNHFVQGTAIGGTPALKLAAPFQNGMVLQRDKPINIWGQADPDTAVSVTIDGNTTNGTSQPDGAWKLTLPALTAGGPHTLTVTSGPDSLILNNVLIGDVWLAFGQSNMVQTLSAMTGSAFYINEIETNNVPVRCLKVTQFGALTPQTESTVPPGHYVNGGMNWLDPSTSETWTSVGTVFAYQMQQATGVPTAIVWAAWGSSSIEGWMPTELAPLLPHFAELLPDYYQVDEVGVVESYATSNGHVTNTAALTSLFTNGWSGATSSHDIFVRTRPNVIYNQMIHPLRDFGISGFVWYQGEANAGPIQTVAEYGFSLPALIKEYRTRFGQGDLPFLGVQLPSYNSTNWPWFREAQSRMETQPNAYAAITIDTGLSGNIHPPDKEPIGIRLALLARKYQQGESIEAHGPRFSSMNIAGNQATITFTNAAGLTTDDALAPATFEVAGSDQVFHPATSATISGNDVIISSTSEPAPVAVRYAWSPAPVNQVNLVNSAGLPAAPFRTDSFPLPGLGAKAPQGIDDHYAVPQNTPLTAPPAGVLDNDIDLNHDPLTAALLTDVSHGTLSLLPDGSFTYTPHSGFAGTDSFTYRCSDAALQSGSTTVTITVTGNQTGYYSWRTTIPWNPGDDQTETGDPEQDGIVNFLEFAFGLNPLLPDPAGLPTLTPSGSDALYDFNNAQPGLTYEVLLSTDLLTWSDPPFATLTSTDPTPVLIPSSEAVNGQLYVRLRVSE